MQFLQTQREESMSYCRFNSIKEYGPKSDVFAYHSIGGGFVCCACHLQQKLVGIHRKNYFIPALRGKRWEVFPDVKFQSRKRLLAHLLEHKKQKHKVPAYAIKRLEKEIMK